MPTNPNPCPMACMKCKGRMLASSGGKKEKWSLRCQECGHHMGPYRSFEVAVDEWRRADTENELRTRLRNNLRPDPFGTAALAKVKLEST